MNKILCFVYFTGALQITKSEEEDKGKYECVAENSIGTEYSKPTSLYVKGKKDSVSLNTPPHAESQKDHRGIFKMSVSLALSRFQFLRSEFLLVNSLNLTFLLILLWANRVSPLEYAHLYPTHPTHPPTHSTRNVQTF